MKKLNLKLAGISEVLTKEQMKKISGGYDDDGGDAGCTTCTSDSSCGAGQKCSCLQNLCCCITVSNGDACTTDTDCGNGKKCYAYAAPMTGHYCGPA